MLMVLPRLWPSGQEAAGMANWGAERGGACLQLTSE